MKKFLNKKNIALILFFIFFGIVFFEYDIVLTWDTSEYIGLAEIIGTKDMVSQWIGHRNIGFPLLLKIFGIGSKIGFKIMLYIFYMAMVIGVLKIFGKCKSKGLFTRKFEVFLGVILTCIFVILNPIIFGYYHTILTEFATMTIITLSLYLGINWLDIDYKENKKQVVLYAVGFACSLIFIYHVKQSLLPCVLMILLITGFISIINEFCKKNILVRLGTFIFATVCLLITIVIWNKAMSSANVGEETINQRLSNKLISGISCLKLVCDKESYQEVNLEDFGLSTEVLQEIQEVLDGNSEYKNFLIYKASCEKYYVYFCVNNSFKEQLIFYLKMCVLDTKDVINSYYKEYKNIICINKDYPIELFKENYTIAMRIFRGKSNVIDVNPEYEEYIQEYRTENVEYNLFTTKYNKFELKLNKYITIITKYNFLMLPVLTVIIFVFYLIFRKKISSDTRKIVEYIIVFYFACLSIFYSYIIMFAIIDRYIVSAMIPMYVGDIMLISLLVSKIKFSKKKTSQKLLNK